MPLRLHIVQKYKRQSTMCYRLLVPIQYGRKRVNEHRGKELNVPNVIKIKYDLFVSEY